MRIVFELQGYKFDNVIKLRAYNKEEKLDVSMLYDGDMYRGKLSILGDYGDENRQTKIIKYATELL